MRDDVPADYQTLLQYMDQSPDGLVIHCRGDIVYLNAVMVRWMGFRDESEALGTPVIRWVHPDDRASVTERVRAAQRDGVAGAPREERFVRPDGQTLTFEVSSQPTTFRGEAGVVVVVRDITQRKRAEAERTEALLCLQRALKSQDDLLYVVSHDLRNPLAAIRSSADLILRAPLETNAAYTRAAHTIVRATARMDRLIGDLLEAGRIGSGSMSFTPQYERISSVLDEALETLRPVAESRKLEIARGGHEGDFALRVRCDRVRVVQVLSNLVANAIHVAPSGSTVTIAAHREAGMLKVSVTDEGPGVEPSEVERLFERFYRSPSATYPGSGLGLFIAKGIVQAHGGEIGVMHRQPTGCAFWFTLPIE